MLTKEYEIECYRHNVTPAQFLAYVRAQLRKNGLDWAAQDIDLKYWAAGKDLNFDTHHDNIHEKSVSRPYEMQTYIRNEITGECYNIICEFDFWDEKTGTGYFYTVNTYDNDAHQNPAETTEESTEDEPEQKTAAEPETVDEPAEEKPEEEHAVNRGALMLERRGCEFFRGDESAKASDIGNYRLVVPGYIFDAKNGRRYCIEITHATKYRTRTTNLRTGQPLKHPVQELVSDCLAHFSFSFEDERGTWGDLEQDRAAWAAEVPYTAAAIVEYLNTISDRPINKLLFVESIEFDETPDADFVPSWKIQDWAKRNRLEWFYHYDQTHVRTHTGEYSYHHYHIEPASADREHVKIYLERVGA